jgi:hypothetical protein
MTITSVVLGVGTPEGGWGEGDWDSATDAIGNADKKNGSNIFMV